MPSTENLSAPDLSMGPMSPCISVCSLDSTGHCLGCMRTSEEIGSWLRLSAIQQWNLLAELGARRAARFVSR
ncbi:MAG: DUF1289 domain-containing protein [Gammaproteobacteria bacterium]|nr:DUF1289 domain-containing protein [Gammaproteobacteria bacterium]